MKDKLTVTIERTRIRRAKRHVKGTRQSVSEFVGKLIDRATEKPERKSWADDLYGSARFTEEELAKDERLRDIVERSKTKPTRRSKAKRG